MFNPEKNSSFFSSFVVFLFKIRILIGTFRCDILLMRYENGFFALQRHLEIRATCKFDWKGFWSAQKEIEGEKRQRKMLKMIRLRETRRWEKRKHKQQQRKVSKFCNCNYIIYYEILIFIQLGGLVAAASVFILMCSIYLIIDNRAQKNFLFFYL